MDTLSQELERQLPFLRRFAFAATQDVEDATSYVEQTIELLILEIERKKITSPRNLKFRAFQLIEIVITAHVKSAQETVCERVMILVHLSDFTKQECKQILDIDETVLNHCLSKLSDGQE